MNKNKPTISVVLPIRNEEKNICQTLKGLFSQDYPENKYEVIVVDGCSEDRTCDCVRVFCKDHANLKLLTNPGLLPAPARNIGIKASKGRYIAIIDGHCYFPDVRFLQNIEDSFQKSGADALGRPAHFLVPDESSLAKAISLARSSFLGHSMNSYIFSDYEGFVSPVSHGAIYRREIFDKIGYFDESFDACEDVDFNYRLEQAGFTTFMAPGLTINYVPRQNLRHIHKQLKRYGYGRFKFLKKHPEALNIDMLIPPAFVLGLVLLFVLLFLSTDHWLFHIVLGLYILYVILTLVVAFQVSQKTSMKYFLVCPIILFTIHLSAGWGFIAALFSLKTWRNEPPKPV